MADVAKCKAHTRAGRQCANPPVAGATVCRMHGGSAPQVKAKAQERVTEQRAQVELRALGEPTPVDATKALTDLLAWKYGEVLWLRAQVQAINVAEVAESVWWRLLRHAEDQLADYAAAAARAGIDERRQQLAEDQGRFAVQVLRRAIDGLLAALTAQGLPAALREAWPALVGEVVPAAIREIAAQEPPTP